MILLDNDFACVGVARLGFGEDHVDGVLGFYAPALHFGKLLRLDPTDDVHAPSSPSLSPTVPRVSFHG
jgi:hypothetical protein